MIDIDWLVHCVTLQQYRYSKHGDKERQNDKLTLDEVEQALLNGRIIEQYADTGRGESCLLVGFTDKGKPIHVVCGGMGSHLIIITVYTPTPPKFINPFERSKSS